MGLLLASDVKFVCNLCLIAKFELMWLSLFTVPVLNGYIYSSFKFILLDTKIKNVLFKLNELLKEYDTEKMV